MRSRRSFTSGQGPPSRIFHRKMLLAGSDAGGGEGEEGGSGDGFWAVSCSENLAGSISCSGSSQRRANVSFSSSVFWGDGGFALPGGRTLRNSPCCVSKPTITITTPISWEPNTTSLFASWAIGGPLIPLEQLQTYFVEID